MVKALREAEAAIGIESYELTEKQQAGKVFSRSLYISKDIKSGEILTSEHVKSIRPGMGLHPKHYKQIIGKKVNRDLTIGDRVDLNDFS
jgi:pseudaminic acid synthase